MKPQFTPLAAALCLFAAGGADARDPVIPLEPPAYFVQGSGGYLYGNRAAATSQGGAAELMLDESTTRNWLAGALATVPIAGGFGVRFAVDGGGTNEKTGGFRSDGHDVTGGTELFWRDPTKGQVGAGYAFSWSPVDTSIGSVTSRTHTAPIFASLYMPDFDGRTVDWNARFEYSWIDAEGATGSVDRWAYEVVGSSRWYVDRWASFEGGVRFAQRIDALPSNEVEGVFELEFLVPGGARHYGTFSLLGSVGRRKFQDLGAQFGMLDQLTWQIGFGATVHFPGVASLVELHRAYR
jgi:hypothetical protein